MRKLLKRILVVTGIAALAIGVGFTSLAGASKAEAADASQFDAGMIITDSLFYDSDAMTVNEIQTFLNEKGKNCTSNCLKNHKLNTTSQVSSPRCDGYVGKNNETAAEVIANVASSCGISPMVLLVMLEKETSLVTMTAPQDWRYERAMGYYCPDDPNRPGWCHPEYAGLFNQLYNASAQLKRYEQNPASYGYKAGQTNKILYNPDSTCGTKSVYIENQATASLYIYTPYTPNQAALNNLYGTGDSCSAYGNRNFWRLYTDWFGPTTAQAPVSKPATTTAPTTAAPKPTATPTSTPKPTTTTTPKPTTTTAPTSKPTTKPSSTPTPTKTTAPTTSPTKTTTPTTEPTTTSTSTPVETSQAPSVSKPGNSSGSLGAAPSVKDPVESKPAQDTGSEDSKTDTDNATGSETDTDSNTGSSASDSDKSSDGEVSAGESTSDDSTTDDSAKGDSTTGADSNSTDSNKDADASNDSLTVIPPRDSAADDEGDASTESASDSTNDSGLTVVPSVTTESQADQDALAQTGAAQILVMLGIVISLGVLGSTLVVARRRHA